MKKFLKLLPLLLVFSMLLTSLCACMQPSETGTTGTPDNNNDQPAPFVDYASTVKFDPASGRASATVTVRSYIDGDTTHFNVPTTVNETGVLKARYLGVNTPESTGKIQPWGKKASNYTKNALKNATSIMIESDTAKWNPDSTGERFLVWVWYKTAETEDYRCLNLEILQAGLAVSSKASDTCYGEICTKILNQAVQHKLYVHSKEKDPDFYYGKALPMTLKELKTNIEKYRDKSVSFEGVVVRAANQTAYVEEYDEETGLYFGIQVYYGFDLGSHGTQILSSGNRVRIVGSVQYYENGGTYQISDITYSAMRPDAPENIKKISEGHSASYTEVTAKDLLTKKISLEITETDDEGNEKLTNKTFDYGFLTMHGTASIKNLVIKEVYTTMTDGSANKGALSITCEAEDGTEIVLRTIVLRDENGNLITEQSFEVGSRIDAKGIVDVYNGVYQLKIFSLDDVTFHEETN